MKIFPLVVSLIVTAASPAADIVALCIGNNEYVRIEDQLDTPINDALLMKQTLESLPGGADVKLLTNASKEDIELALNSLKTRAQGARLALVFYSGHGMDGQPDGYVSEDTFLLPVEAVIPDVNYLHSRAVSVKTVLDALKAAPVTARAVILDCCRSGAPMATAALAGSSKNFGDLDERVKTALGKAVIPDATLIAFAASPGRKAAAFLTDADTNSPFTQFLSTEFRTGQGNLRDLVEAAAEQTEEATGRRQVPYVCYTGAASAIRQIVFHPVSSGGTSAVPMTLPSVMPLAEIKQPAIPPSNITGNHSGFYSYGAGFPESLQDTTVTFQINVKQPQDKLSFTGLVNEEYTGFGTPQNDRVWADVAGTCRYKEGVLNIQFVKTYRYFTQNAVTYSGTYDASNRTVRGTWSFPPSAGGASGTFQLNNVILK